MIKRTISGLVLTIAGLLSLSPVALGSQEGAAASRSKPKNSATSLGGVILPHQNSGVQYVDKQNQPTSPKFGMQRNYEETSSVSEETGVNITPSVSEVEITPNSKSEILDEYGLVRAIEGNQISIRLVNGKAKNYRFAENSSGNQFRRGSLVGFNINRKGEITHIQRPPVQKIYEGTLVVVDGKKIGMVTPEGERFVTTLSKEKIAQLGLAPGQAIKIIQYQGTWVTKVIQPSR